MSSDNPDCATRIFALQQALGLPDRVGQETKQMVDRLYEQGPDGFEGLSVDIVVAACLLLVARIHDEGVVPGELADHADVDQRLLLRRSRSIATELGLDPSAIFNATQYISVICDRLNLDDGIERQAELIAEHGREEGVTSGKNPRGIAAAAVYSAAYIQNARVNQAEVSEAIDISEVTIRNRYKELLKANPPLLDSDFSPASGDGTRELDASGDSEHIGLEDGWVDPPTGVFDDAMDMVDTDPGLERRAEELFRLAQESPRCEFAMSERIGTWAVAAVCVAAEQLGKSPSMEKKSSLAAVCDVSAGDLEAHCFKLRQAWEN